MPKKRHQNLYSKPLSTVHPSLNSAGPASSGNHSDAPPTVNELITNLRRSHVSAKDATSASTVVTQTLPPQIRQLLSQTETPTPRPRDRRQRFDASGRRLPPGPAPPRSWLEGSRHGRSRITSKERLYPHSVDTLPGIIEPESRKLQDMCLRGMAKEWEFIRVYESRNLADLPAGLRMLLLSYIAVYGPEEGIGGEGLDSLLASTNGADCVDTNEGFFRLDLSGSVGRSISFRQLIELVQQPSVPLHESERELSWEDAISPSLSAPISHLTHLSISHPPSNVSWTRFLSFAKIVPTLTHLSLAHWPVPSLTPNSKTAVMSSPHGKDVQLGGTNYYSHSLDHDFQEAGNILKRLASSIYNLEYLNLEGCIDWLEALHWTGTDAYTPEGVDWATQWVKLQTLIVRCGYALHEDSEFWEVAKFAADFKLMFMTQKFLARFRRQRWVEVVRDDWEAYEGLWKGRGEENARKRAVLHRFDGRWWSDGIDGHLGESLPAGEIERRSVWEQ